MPAASPQTVKLKSTLRLLIPRLRNAQQKDTSLSITARREISSLLAQNREASARIRVENIIATDICVELMEILELYCELLLARAGLLDVRDKNIKDGIIPKDSTATGAEGSTEGGGDETGLEEAASAIIYSAPRLPRDVRELGVVRGLLIDRFGKDFALRCNENKDGIVPERVVNKLKVEPPNAKLVQAYLEEIARSYGIDWPKRDEELEEARTEVDAEDDGDDSDGVGGGMKEEPIAADGSQGKEVSTPKPKKANLKTNLGGLRDATPPSSLQPGGAKSPVSVAPPAARTDNPSPKVKMPGGPQTSSANSKKDASTGGAVGGKVPTVDDLASRFQALKRS